MVTTKTLLFCTFQTVEIVTTNADRLRRGLGKQKHAFYKHCIVHCCCLYWQNIIFFCFNLSNSVIFIKFITTDHSIVESLNFLTVQNVFNMAIKEKIHSG